VLCLRSQQIHFGRRQPIWAWSSSCPLSQTLKPASTRSDRRMASPKRVGKSARSNRCRQRSAPTGRSTGHPGRRRGRRVLRRSRLARTWRTAKLVVMILSPRGRTGFERTGARSGRCRAGCVTVRNQLRTACSDRVLLGHLTWRLDGLSKSAAAAAAWLDRISQSRSSRQSSLHCSCQS
jgi:hypothetical protein